ncbi:Repeat domain-containing protein [Nannocystis exedens]|uniref:Repeat domain-containing protein n=1 Tax=Nannocystis exedens TaxID=54 RepID=A0A1I1WG59_9BACT|nr:FG-GAP-like repeat-containing protein [Nannocystis exedens]PCC67695.1 FG-GAP repeat protein [Nannocystis exedens]SFD94156.1 Repeat domain-containing protein [Nannocystis exedens]
MVTSSFPLVHAPSSVVVADFDGDTDLDIATGAPGLSRIEVQLNSGSGDFVPGSPIGLMPATGELHLAAGDVDGDGDPDLAAAQQVPSDVNVLIGQAGQWMVTPTLDAVSGTRRVHFADGDGDGIRDLVTICETSPTVATWTSTAFTGGLLADFDGDGRLDLIAVGELPAVSVLRGDGDGGFVCEQVFELEAPTTRDLLAAGDVDGDGRMEIVAGEPDLLEIQIVTTL